MEFVSVAESKFSEEKHLEPIQHGNFSGILFDMPDDVYHRSKPWSSTHLKKMYSSCPQVFHHSLSAPKTESAQMRLGSLVHTLVLTPETFDRQFYVMPTVDGRTKEGKAIRETAVASARGRSIVLEDELEEARIMLASVMSCKSAVQLLEGAIREPSIFWRCVFSNLSFRARVDALGDDYFVELKTTSNASPEAFSRQIFNMNYDLQLAHYRAGLTAIGRTMENILMIAVETEPPYVTQCYRVCDSFLESGHQKWLEAVTKLESGLSSQEWPAYAHDDPDDIPLITAKSWMMKAVESV